MSRLTRLSAILAAGAAAILALSACTSGGADKPESTDQGGTSSLQTITPGKLTIATGEPAYAPWVIDNDPSSGKGFESAVAYAVAEKLGFAKSAVVWVGAAFEASIAPGPKDWDLNIQQFSVTPEREKAVDFSSPYYTTTQAVVANGGTKAAEAKSIADLKGSVIGVASGTTSLTVAESVLGK
ncbi:MAG: transporter substrate-binding domain-containing protein, partial [Actinobacteria bacterium]|nr:transporter substrate-binding domain-containing protein [Actinomycetota bacterium]